MNEKMMQWSDDMLIAEYWLNIRLNGEAAADEARYSYETIQEIREVAKLRNVDLISKFRDLRYDYLQMTAEELQAEYVRLFKLLGDDYAAETRIQLEALFDASDKKSIELIAPPFGSNTPA